VTRTKSEISDIMRKVKGQGTSPEILFRRAVKELGFRPIFNPTNIHGKPDLVFRKNRVAVFIDGDFWHGNQWVRRRLPSLDHQFSKPCLQTMWAAKIRMNMSRDSAVSARLAEDGWSVVRFWESDIMSNLNWCISSTVDAINSAPAPKENILAQRTFAEFFAGIGLVRMGLERQGWKIRFANDCDIKKKEIYSGHFADAHQHFLLDDIHRVDADQIPSVTLATASFPCNDLSLAGARGGLHARNSSAFWGFINLIEQMQDRKPPLILLENVPGFITSHKGQDFREALSALNRLGYVVDPFLLDANKFVPQSRLRLFVVAVHTSLPHSFPSPPPNFESDNILRPKLLSSFVRQNSDLLWYLRTLPRPPERRMVLADVVDELPYSDTSWWSEERKQYLFNQFSPKHKEIALQMINRRSWSYGTIFRRIRNDRSMAELRTDGVAGCLRTPRGGSGRQILFKAGYGKYFARLLNPVECARLMGADQYRLSPDIQINQALFGFGDAVCVPAIEWITTYYLNPLINELIRSRPAYK